MLLSRKATMQSRVCFDALALVVDQVSTSHQQHVQKILACAAGSCFQPIWEFPKVKGPNTDPSSICRVSRAWIYSDTHSKGPPIYRRCHLLSRLPAWAPALKRGRHDHNLKVSQLVLQPQVWECSWQDANLRKAFDQTEILHDLIYHHQNPRDTGSIVLYML